jgi:putative FmdB family regulatory protein
MPIYEYLCGACGHHLEALQKMSESPLRKCPECGKSQLKRLVSASQFRLKGSGWYETDFKNKGETKRNLVERGGAESSEAASDKSTDTAAKEEAGKAIAAAKKDGDAPAKPAKAKPVAKPAAARSKSAAKSRGKAARG